jgi:2-dehydropantoate 2-reductase
MILKMRFDIKLSRGYNSRRHNGNGFSGKSKNMNILIYGGGAVGLGLASCLLKSRTQADILARPATVQALRKNGLKRTGIFGNYYAEPSEFGSFTMLEEIQGRQYDYILVCTKSFDSQHAVKDLYEHISIFTTGTKIVLSQNGWGNAEEFLSFFDKGIIYNARIITGFQRPSLNEVTVTVHADSIHIGSLFGCDLSAVEKLCTAINDGDIPCITTNLIVRDIWAKMLYNCALNPLGAVLEVPYGVLARYEPTRIIMNGIVEEVFTVMKKAGYGTHWDSAGDFLEVFYDKLVPDTAEHKSSTLQDIAAGKPTEIDALNGAVIKMSRQHGISVPYNLMVFNMIRFLEAKSLGR